MSPTPLPPFPRNFSALVAATSLVLGGALALPEARALSHDFDEGFRVGRSVSGQPALGTTWGGPSTWLMVSADAGRTGAGLSMPATFPGPFTTQMLTPEAADLGDVAAKGVVLVSFDLRLDDVPASTATNNALVLRIGQEPGGPCAVRINIKDSGAVRYMDAGQEASGRTRLERGVWTRFKLLIDFDGGYATLSIDDGAIMTLAFGATTEQTRFGRIEILSGRTESAYRRFSFDNLVCTRP